MENLTTGSLGCDNASAGAASSSTASTSCTHYHVFINHRGPDVKNGFASHLYRSLCDRGLSVFLDREELEEGQNISSQIEDAIRDASVHVAIFSPTYAQSNWCLDELVLMKNSRAIILPVFYKVDPSVVRWTVKEGAYAEALQQLEKKTTHDSETGKEKPRYGSHTIQNWRNALSYVADLSGFVHGDKDDEGELLNKVVETVLKKVPKTLLDVAKFPTGLDNILEEFEKTVLSQRQERELVEAKVVGIVGVGGLGKTTLAKEFFNLRSSDYNSSSFLFDVRENASTMSLAHLQNKLLRNLTQKDIKIDSRDEGIGILKRNLSSCHVLIVLDDVDHTDQLEAVLPIKKILKPDSLILVTSRDKHVLTTSGVLESSIYNLKAMNMLHSKDLFCSYAFHQPDPVPEFADLVDRFVTACSGLPLSLKVFGAQVFDKNKRIWQEILDELDSVLPDEIHYRLKISFDSLNAKDKEIFLDIACFFIGEDGDMAVRILGEAGVRNLQDKCLVELDEENKIKMHDHIRDMGRKIAEEGSLPGRLWHWTGNIIDDLLEQPSTVITEVRGIKMFSSSFDVFRHARKYGYPGLWSLEKSWYKNIEMRHLSSFKSLEIRLKNLGLVATEGGYLDDILRRVQSPNLIWLRWYGCTYSSLPSSIPMKNLRVLEVQGTILNILWPHQSQAVPLELRELNIYAPLSEIPKSIGQLKYLERIAIRNTSESITVERLPDEICSLRSLKYLVLKGFSRMMSLPDSFGELANLEYIDLEGASNLQMLPNSFGDLTLLKHLSLRYCNNLTISSEALGNITMLKLLDLSYCKQVKELPPQVARQGSLQKLSLHGSKLKELPSVIGDLCNLEVLELGSDLLEVLPLGLGALRSLKILSLYSLPQLKSLPVSIGLLRQLTKLVIKDCGIEYLPQEFLHMNNLENLTVRFCPLREHPFKKKIEGVGETLLLLDGERALNKLNSSNNRCMFGLKKLYLLNTDIREIFFDEGVCPNLQQLSLDQCSELRQIGGLCCPKLRYLDIRDCTKVEELPFFETLTSLETLNVERCEKLQSITGLGQLTKLTKLYVDKCREMRELQGVEHLTSLEKLLVGECEKLQSIQLGKLRKLTELRVYGCHEMRELPGVEHLTSLEKLVVRSCEKLQSITGLGQLTKLTELYVDDCREMRELPGVEHSTSLEKLDVGRCEKLQSIRLGQLRKLTKLNVHECHEMRELPGVEHLTSLEKLVVRRCEKLQSIPGFGLLAKLTELKVGGCHEMREFPCVEHLISLEKLCVGECEKLQSIPGLGQLTKLTKLNVYECREMRELLGVEHLTALEKLDVERCEKLQSIPGLGNLRKLAELNFGGCHEIRQLRGVEHLTSLKKLHVLECQKLQSLPGLRHLTKLTKLLVDGCHEIPELPSSEHLTSLEKLDVWGCEKLHSIPRLGYLTKLTELVVDGCHELRELPGVEHLNSLEKLDVWRCEKLQSIPGLGHLTKLIELDVHGCREIRELPGVEHLTSLKKLNVERCEKLQSIPGLGYLTKLTELNVDGCCEIQELPGVEHLTSLETLDVGGCQKLQSMPGLGQLTNLKKLNVNRYCEILELPGVEHLTSLKKLDVWGCEKLQSIPGLGHLRKLTELDVHGCPEIRELLGVEHLTSLEKLDVGGCEKLQSIPGLGYLTKLTELGVEGCCEMRELPGVEHLTSLKTLYAGKCLKLQWSEGVLAQLRQQLKDGFKYETQRERGGCLQFLQFLCEMINIDYNSGQTQYTSP